jgi:hypothetical protein
MTSVIIPERNKAQANFVAVKNITIKYPAGSAISKELSGKDERIQFTVSGGANSTSNGISNAIAAFNKALLQAQSPVIVTQLNVTYTGVIKGSEDNALMSFKVQAVPQMEKLVIGSQGDNSTSAANNSTSAAKIVDLAWRGISVTDPIVLKDPKVGELEINKPINFIDKTHKDLAKDIFNSPLSNMFSSPIMTWDRFKQPMGTWHFLFDPSGSLVESSSFYKEQSGAKVVSVYSLGESSFREGTFKPEEADASGSVGGTQVQAHSQVPAPSGQIQIAGFSKLQTNAGGDFAIVTADNPEGPQNATGNFPLQVLLVLGGMMGAIAVFILFKARK